MKKFFSTLIVILTFISCNDQPVNPETSPKLRLLSNAEIKVSSSVNDFGFSLFRKVNNGENTFISPLSVSIALGMVLNGASEETKQSIINTIGFDGLSPKDVNQAHKDLIALLYSMDETVTMGIANSVWYDNTYTVKDKFSGIIKDFYDGTVQPLDFKSAGAPSTINNWASDKTNNRIKDLIDQISPYEIMFLINAIYFKGGWQYVFDASKTHEADFTREDGSVTTVDMMFSKNTKIQYTSNNDVQLIDVPYGNGQFRMTFILPKTGTLHDLTESLTASKLNDWIEESYSPSVELEIPKFKISWKKDLKSSLESMGMNTYSFPELVEDPLGFEISRVIHQSFLEVNEEGAEAAAATAIAIDWKSLSPKITIDKPFIFFIREKYSGIILFSGQLLDPSILQ